MEITTRTGDELTAADVYEIWRIRDVVFAVEQQCDEPDVDGVDLRPDCTHLWFAGDDGRIQSYLRTFVAGGVRKIGRVATLKEVRGQGLSGALLREVISRYGDEELRMGAQAYLENWYASFGFEVCGEPFVEAGIDHVPMRRPANR
ncbi:MAG: GNAT family N-acetyltransferase [Gordonia sp. (in: high G+C Gram-positive bacteria)]|uniref:GNAT family N-acetyltransferase n=1 Tax=Gordonia sp. (in: high G+C Gram-positive bacteria) TaxID=84139 RepID=UPI0039E2E770